MHKWHYNRGDFPWTPYLDLELQVAPVFTLFLLCFPGQHVGSAPEMCACISYSAAGMLIRLQMQISVTMYFSDQTHTCVLCIDWEIFL